MNGQAELDQDFRDSIVKSLATLTERTETILKNQARFEDFLRAVDQKVNCLDIELTAHPVNCPVRGTVERMERELASGAHPGSKATLDRLAAVERAVEDWNVGTNASRLTSNRWLTTIMPLLYLVAGGIFVLFLLHSHELLQSVARVKP